MLLLIKTQVWPERGPMVKLAKHTFIGLEATYDVTLTWNVKTTQLFGPTRWARFYAKLGLDHAWALAQTCPASTPAKIVYQMRKSFQFWRTIKNFAKILAWAFVSFLTPSARFRLDFLFGKKLELEKLTNGTKPTFDFSDEFWIQLFFWTRFQKSSSKINLS